MMHANLLCLMPVLVLTLFSFLCEWKPRQPADQRKNATLSGLNTDYFLQTGAPDVCAYVRTCACFVYVGQLVFVYLISFIPFSYPGM